MRESRRRTGSVLGRLIQDRSDQGFEAASPLLCASSETRLRFRRQVANRNAGHRRTLPSVRELNLYLDHAIICTSPSRRYQSISAWPALDVGGSNRHGRHEDGLTGCETAGERGRSTMQLETGTVGGGDASGDGGGGARGGRAGERLRGHHRRGHQRRRPRGGRLGDRRDRRPADDVPQDRRDRRRRPLPVARAARGGLLGLGARLRPGRLDAGDRRAGAGPAADGGRCGDAPGSRRGLSGRALVVADRGAGGGGVPRHRPRGQRHQRGPAHPRRVPLQREGLPALPPGRRRVHARAPRRARPRLERRRVGRARPHGAARGGDEHVDVALRPRPRAAHVRRLERPRRHRRGAAGAPRARGGSSATWSSPSGSGPTRWARSTTRRPPTSGTPR